MNFGPDPWRMLARDGARRQEVRTITSEVLIDYGEASWGEWVTLGWLAEACAQVTA